MDFIAAHPVYDILCLIQATSPLIVPQDFIDGLDKMRSATVAIRLTQTSACGMLSFRGA